MEKLLVGGAVRDKLLGKTPSDLDYLVLGATEQELLDLGYKRIKKDFPVFLDPDTGDECSLPRQEVSTGPGYTDFVTKTDGVTVREDLKRRDFTINAMAMKNCGEVVDPFGGRDDLEKGVIRHTSEAFGEDPLRVFRLARFQAKFPDFVIADETFELAKSIDVSYLPGQRVYAEMLKAFKTKRPDLFFVTLKNLGQLGVWFPELEAMVGVEHNNSHHLEGDVFNHTMMVLHEARKLTDKPEVLIGALLHDMGKPVSVLKYGDMYKHDDFELFMPLLETAAKRLSFPKKVKRAVMQAAKYHHFVHKLDEVKATTIVKKMAQKDFPRNKMELFDLVYVSVADALGRIDTDKTPSALEVLKKYVIVFDYFAAFHSVNVKDLKGLPVQRVKSELHQRRVSAAKSV